MELKGHNIDGRKNIDRKLKLNNVLFEIVLDEYTLRESQEKALTWFKNNIPKGKKYFICDLPVGSGKSLLAMLFIRHYLEEVNKEAKFDLLTCTKNLQEQYLESFGFLNNLWGKSNYQCDKHNHNCEYGKTCNQNNNETCDGCPHTTAFERWKDGKISLTNFHIHGLYSIYTPVVMTERGANMLIVDEAHSLEQTINGFVSFNLSKKTWDSFIDKDLSEKWDSIIMGFSDIEEINNWLKKEYLPTIDKVISSYSAKMKNPKDLEKTIKIFNQVTSAKNIIDNYLDSYKINSSNWVADKKVNKGEIVWDIQPIWTDKIMKKTLWDKYNHVVLMSGSILNPEMFCEINGIDISEVAYIKLGMKFPIEKRPIYYLPVGKMSYKSKDETWNNMIPIINKIIDKYKDKKGIIFCTYDILFKMKEVFKDKRFIYVEPQNRQEMIDKHTSSKDSTILVSASLYQGIDLKDDLSRFQVFLKIPYPSLASKVNSERMKKNGWYNLMTVIDLVQGYGRSIRNEEDWADTYILDSCFTDILTSSTNILPKYFTNAIKKLNFKK